jgi:hypothetical protein
MQNRLYAIVVLVVVLGICCLGLYIAISGYLNNNPYPFLATDRGTLPIFTAIPIVIPTDTPAPLLTHTPGAIKPTAAPPTVPFISIPAPIAPTATGAAPAPTLRPNTPAPSPTAQPVAGCGGFQFCNFGGPPDLSLAPSSGIGCPSNYIWGRVIDLSGKGLADRKVRYKNVTSNEVLPPVNTKNTPDIPGKYDIPTGSPGGQWIVWMQGDDGSPASPQVTILTQNYVGAGNCPNRIDFRQQR